MATKIKELFSKHPKKYEVMWRARHFIIGKPIRWNIIKFLQSCRKTYVILNNDYKTGWGKYFPEVFDMSGISPSRIRFILLDNVEIDQNDKEDYGEEFGNHIRLHRNAITLDEIMADMEEA